MLIYKKEIERLNVNIYLVCAETHKDEAAIMMMKKTTKKTIYTCVALSLYILYTVYTVYYNIIAF